MKPQTRQPVHPGGILRRQYQEPLAISVSHLAVALKVSRKTVSKLVNEHGSVTPDMALRLSVAFDTTAELWMNLQRNHDLWKAAHETNGWKDVRKIAA